ncbi:hypothetical protein [Micromonospora antibiotica]|uniref:Uncharacterized protein n=1 Tax=Micromonospora antibiotica TaxID=2807623 RepID=A0ABS3VEJ5_9ACTN|nr:hypothetical protein [Micromonospora antibiotica]MBO4164061.1 hypothetical protein [Micromonospora antibiotica]
MPTPPGHAPRPVIRLAAVGTGLAGVAVVCWAVGMTRWQPLTEPAGPWSERLPGAHTYWARDLRFLALVAVVSGLVLAGGGRRSWALPAVLLGGAALAADVAVDRADPTGPGATVLLVAAGWLAVGITATLGVRRDAQTGVDGPIHRATGADPGNPPGGAGVAAPDSRGGPAARHRAGVAGRDRTMLTGMAIVAAVSALVAVLTRSPTDREPALGPATLVTGLLLLTLTVAGALAAVSGRGRARSAAGCALAAVGGVGLLLVRLVGPADRLLPAAVLGAVLLVGVTSLTRPGPDAVPAWRRYAVLVPVTLVAPLALWYVALLVSAAFPLGASLTALAGNSPVGGGDPDVLPALAGLCAGLGTALLLTRPLPGVTRRPAAPPRCAAGTTASTAGRTGRTGSPPTGSGRRR